MATKIDLLIEQGTTFTKGFAVDLTSLGTFDNTWSVKAQVRTSAKSSTLLYEWSASNSNVVIEGSVIKLSVSPATSSAFAWTNAVYDLEISKAGVVYRIIEGKVKISQEVTK